MSPDFPVFHTIESVKLPFNSKAPTLSILMLALILQRLGYGLRTLNTLSPDREDPD